MLFSSKARYIRKIAGNVSKYLFLKATLGFRKKKETFQVGILQKDTTGSGWAYVHLGIGFGSFKQTWALALYFQVRSPLSALFISMDRYRSSAHLANFQVRSSLNRSQ